MTNDAFSVLAFSVILGTIGALVAFYPRALPKITNKYYAFIHMRTRLVEDDYDKLGIRVAGGALFILALYALIARWPSL